MRFSLTLNIKDNFALLPASYQYPMSAAIYKIIDRADSEYATFLHNKGYARGSKHFKLFTFSDINSPFRIKGDRLELYTNRATLQVCFHMPDALGHFVRGLFMNQRLEVCDRISRVVFEVVQVEMAPPPVLDERDGYAEAVLQPLSPVVAGMKDERGYYQYLSPADDGFAVCLVHNWVEKYLACYPDAGTAEELKEKIAITILPQPEPPKSRLITIKANTPEQTQVRGYMKFKMQVRGPVEMVELLLDCGVGLNNAVGFGCVGIKKPGG